MASRTAPKDCPVCLGVHDEPIHLATVRLHRWWRESLLNRLSEPGEPYQPLADKPPVPNV